MVTTSELTLCPRMYQVGISDFPSRLQALPTLVQVMVGVGTPEAVQGREAGTPSLVTWWVAVGWILGGTFINRPIFKMLYISVPNGRGPEAAPASTSNDRVTRWDVG